MERTSTRNARTRVHGHPMYTVAQYRIDDLLREADNRRLARSVRSGEGSGDPDPRATRRRRRHTALKRIFALVTRGGRGQLGKVSGGGIQ
jgi:hypothetical protein